MRERRHLSGNSNTPRPASAHVTSTSSNGSTPREALPSKCSDRSGAASARRPEVSTGESQPSPPASHKRRIHSARVERSASTHASIPETPVPRSLLRGSAHSDPIVAPQALPRLAVNPLGVGAASVQWAVSVTNSSEFTATSDVPEHLKPVLQDFSALLRDRYEGKRSLRLAFLNWDRDKDGKLCVPEIREMIQTLGLAKKLGRESVDALLSHVASLPSQSLRYDDFCGFVYRSNAPQGASKPTGDAAKPSTPHTAAGTESVEAPDVQLSSDRALYPDVEHVVNLLRKKYESRPLRSVFRHWDADKDGCITLTELDVNLRRQGLRLPPSQLKELFAKHDVDQDGRIMYQDFVSMIYGPVTVEHHNPVLQAHLREATKRENQPADPYTILKNSALENPVRRFDEDAVRAAVQQKLRVFAPRIHDAYSAFDDDHDGNLSYLEFRQGLNELGLHFNEREFLHLATLVDTDGSGEISFKEFTHMFQRQPKDPRHPEDRADEKGNTDPELQAKQQARLSQGTFDFSHLTRRAKVATRHGKTPYGNTKDLISPTSGQAVSQFRTEASLYGTGQKTPRSGAGHCMKQNQEPSQTQTPQPQYTLGQQEKQRKDALYALRLDRIRQTQQQYDAKTAPLQDAFDVTQQRRVETLHRHQQRYQTSIEDSRPHQSPQGVGRAREATRPPYIND